MALWIGFDGVGLTAYPASRTSTMSKGISHVCLPQRLLKRPSADRDLRRFECDFPVLSVAGRETYTLR